MFAAPDARATNTRPAHEANLQPPRPPFPEDDGNRNGNVDEQTDEPPQPLPQLENQDHADGGDGDATRAVSDVQRVAAEMRNAAVAEQMSSKAAVRDRQTAHRRLMRDYRTLETTLATAAGESLGISAHPIDDDLFRWRAVVAGPEGSAWEGGLFKLELVFPDSYPLEPPHVRFLTKGVFHPNVYVDGNICLDTLKSCWSPMLDVESLLLSIRSLLSDPNPRSAANGEAARMLVESRAAYDEQVRHVAEQSLEQSFSDMGVDSDDCA